MSDDDRGKLLIHPAHARRAAEDLQLLPEDELVSLFSGVSVSVPTTTVPLTVAGFKEASEKATGVRLPDDQAE